MASQVALMVKYPPANAGDTRNAGSVPGLGRSPGRGNSNPLQSSCLENSMDRRAWQATVHGTAKSRTQLSNWARTHVPFTFKSSLEDKFYPLPHYGENEKE